MYKCPYCDEWMGCREMHRPCPALISRIDSASVLVRKLGERLARAIGECAKAKDDLRKLEDETQWSEATLVVDGKEVGIRMRGSMFVLQERPGNVTVESKDGEG